MVLQYLFSFFSSPDGKGRFGDTEVYKVNPLTGSNDSRRLA